MTFPPEYYIVLQQIVERYDDVDLNGVTIDAHRIPEILSSLVKHYRTEELETLISAVDPEGKHSVPNTTELSVTLYHSS